MIAPLIAARSAKITSPTPLNPLQWHIHKRLKAARILIKGYVKVDFRLVLLTDEGKAAMAGCFMDDAKNTGRRSW